VRNKEVWVNGNKIYPSQSCVVGQLNSIEKTPETAFDNLFIMEEAVAGTSTVTPLDGIDIDVDNLIDSIDPIGAPFDPSTPNTEVPSSIYYL
jgi:hypothetical protein